jgi:hypothetical protein
MVDGSGDSGSVGREQSKVIIVEAEMRCDASISAVASEGVFDMPRACTRMPKDIFWWRERTLHDFNTCRDADPALGWTPFVVREYIALLGLDVNKFTFGTWTMAVDPAILGSMSRIRTAQPVVNQRISILIAFSQRYCCRLFFCY